MPPVHIEPGFELVATLRRPERPDAEWIVSRRAGRLRIRDRRDRAWEFDDAGRLVVEEREDVHREFTLDQRSWGHRVVGRGPARRLRPLSSEEDAGHRIRRAHALARCLQEALLRDALGVEGAEGDPRLDDARRALELPAGWNADTLREDLRRWHSLLRSVPVLPPDQYGALPVQLTEGCSWDRCHFCSLYRDVPYRERTPEEVAAALDAIVDHLGRSSRRFRRLFLGQANALLLEDDTLHAHLDVIDARWPRPPAGLDTAERRRWVEDRERAVFGFGAFVDAFHRPRAVDSWRSLGRRGLLRVHLGVESGSEALLRELGKPVRVGAVADLVDTLHAAGVPVGLILLAMDLEPERQEDHFARTVDLIRRLAPRRGDQVYLSPLVPSGRPAASSASRRVAERLRGRLREVLDPSVPTALYDLPLLGQRSPRR